VKKQQIFIGRILLNRAINVKQISRQLAISRNTVKSYIKYMVHLLMTVQLEVSIWERCGRTQKGRRKMKRN